MSCFFLSCSLKTVYCPPRDRRRPPSPRIQIQHASPENDRHFLLPETRLPRLPGPSGGVVARPVWLLHFSSQEPKRWRFCSRRPPLRWSTSEYFLEMKLACTGRGSNKASWVQWENCLLMSIYFRVSIF